MTSKGLDEFLERDRALFDLPPKPDSSPKTAPDGPARICQVNRNSLFFDAKLILASTKNQCFIRHPNQWNLQEISSLDSALPSPTSRLDVPIPISSKNHYANQGSKPSDTRDNMPTFRSWIDLQICICSSLPAGINDKGATPPGGRECTDTNRVKPVGVPGTIEPMKMGGRSRSLPVPLLDNLPCCNWN